MKTVLLLSGHLHVRDLTRSLAEDLARDHRVIVLINTVLPQPETKFWRDFRAGTVVDFRQAVQQAKGRSDLRTPAFIHRLETELGVPLYKATSNFQLYRRIFKSYFGWWPRDSFYAKENEVLDEYLGSYLALTEIFERYAPDLIFQETVDLISTFVALALGYRRGVFALGFDMAPGFDDARMVISYGIHRQNLILNKLFAQPELLSPGSREGGEKLLERFAHLADHAPWYVRPYGKNMQGVLGVAREKLQGKLFNKNFWGHPLKSLERLESLIWLEKHCQRTLPAEPYIAFFLQHQPEASSCTYAPRWVNQEAIIEQLAINAPYGLKIVIKENPRTYGIRGKRYFGPLLEIPNVHMLHPAVNSYAVAQRAEAVLAIIGSIGLEGILMGKRVAVLGRPYYSIYPGVKRLNYPEEVFDALQDSSWQPAALKSELHNFAAAFWESAHAFGKVAPGEVWPPAAVAGPNLGQALRRTLGFIEQHGLRPRDYDPGLPVEAIL
ncbi:MAG: hypothetical protein AB1424_03545 [Thermodesulfobacteriota bacterium]